MEAKAAAAGLFMVLLACGAHPGSIRWEPYSKSAPSNQVASVAIEVGAGDLAALRKSGAMPLGVMTMRGDDPAAVDERTGIDAAEYGGTHWARGTVKDSGGTWTVAPYTDRRWELHVVVLRVPRGAWDSLPVPLQPTAKD